MTTDNSTAALLIDLLRELSSELDLHYEDQDMHSIVTTINVMKTAAATVQANGSEPPVAYLHILRRFEAATRR